jgi:hypothetical protein
MVAKERHRVPCRPLGRVRATTSSSAIVADCAIRHRAYDEHMASRVRCHRVAVLLAVVSSLVACHKPKAQSRTAPVSATVKPALFMRESLAATREALAAAYRLSLDARLVGAIALVAELVGAPLSEPPAVSWVEAAHGWDIRVGPDSLGTLDELCSFGPAHALLLDWAKKQIAAHPLMEETRPLPAFEPMFDEAAVRAVRNAGKTWGNPAQRGRAIHAMSGGLLSLALQSFDAMDAADALLAAAWAATALDEAGSHAQPAQKMVLAHVLGYRRAAQQAAAWVPDTSAVRAYVLFDNKRLQALADDPATDLVTRYLWLRRLLLSDLGQEAETFLAGHMADARGSIPVVQAQVMWGDFQIRRSLAESGPAVVLRSLMRDAGDRHAERVAKAQDSRDESRILRQLDVDEGGLLAAFDGALAALLPDKSNPTVPALTAYYRAAMLTALRDKGHDYLHVLCSNKAAAAFARSVRDDKGKLATTFAPWFDSLVAADAGQPVTGELLANLQPQQGIGGLALLDVFETIHAKEDWANPMSYAAARALMARLDSRPDNRDLAGQVAYRLPDLRLYERMHRSFVEVAPGVALSSQASFAVFAGDKALLEQTTALPQLRPCDRIHVAATRVDLGLLPPQAAMREVQTAALGDREGSRGLECLIAVLENVVAANKIESWRLPHGGRAERTRNVTRAISSDPNGAIVRLARMWLDAHPDPRGLDGASVRGSLARALRRMGKPKEALLAIEPAVSTGQGGAMRETAIAHALLNHADQARSLIAAAASRYPGASSVVAQAAIEWRLGNPIDAAKIVKQSGKPGKDFNRELGAAMADAFVNDKTPGLETAVNELFKASIRQDAKEAVLDELVVTDVKRAVAVIDQLAEPVQQQYAIIRHYNAIRSVKGDEAAQALGRKLLRSAPPSLAKLAISAYGEEAPLWFLSEPPSPQERDLLWLFRAVAAQRNPRSVYVDALKRHFAKPSPDGGRGGDRYYVLGRLVMGLESEEVGTSLRGTTPSTSCEAAFYLGARAQGLGKLDEAHDWYRVAVETSLPREAEYHFALGQLDIWSSQGKSLARIAKEPMR